MPGVRPPMIGIKAREPEGFQQRFEPQKNLVLPTPKNIRQDGTSVVIDGMPQPAWIPLVANKRPHLIHLGFACLLKVHLTFRTLFRTFEAILEEPPAERGAGATYRLLHAL